MSIIEEPRPVDEVPEPSESFAPPKSDRERKAMLAQTVSNQIAQGHRVESQSDFQAVLVKGKPCNHVLHAIITLFTLGLWAIAWIVFAIAGGEKRSIVGVDEFGNVTVAKV